jgi:hypothetical protein
MALTFGPVFITNGVFLLILLVILKIESVLGEFSTINFIIIFGLANERQLGFLIAPKKIQHFFQDPCRYICDKFTTGHAMVLQK